MREDITLTSDIPQTARVMQVASMFDVPVDQKNVTTWKHNLPFEDKPWQVGLIVGPSGAGKSVLAKRLWPGKVREQLDWPHDKAIIDAFPTDMSIKDVTGLLTSVGLGSAPAWLRPYGTLSNGEKFRADMARAIAQDDDPVIIDEFTSVVDRQVARVASHAVQKAIRRSGRQFVAVTCHYDVLDWLQPDWVYDVAAGTFAWRSVQPHPPLRLTVHESSRADWKMFARHHYLSADISNAAQCFTAYLDGVPVAFTSYLHFMHAKTRNIKMGHRLVVLPDYQGLGIAGRLEDWLGQHLRDKGFRYRNVVAHPAMIRLYTSSPRWRETGAKAKRVATSKKSLNAAANLSSRRLNLRSFEYTPPRTTTA
ncbi:ATP binding protein [Gordonia phage Jace]|uniref:ATP binding protein n=1 Tax=Gordonia phage Jace TaxID=2182360 RepID=A0A2U8UJS0_9CAUD|nr:ATP binding protein [Gordonia phage Jace]AWN03706.1 ATP binding protein [Gordonia phage Jace]